MTPIRDTNEYTARRIVLIHALTDSLQPSREAFNRVWPEARVHNVVDDSLSVDLSIEGGISERMFERIFALGTYAASTGAQDERTDAILFACSAFGPAIDRVKHTLSVPVLRPNEAAFEKALNAGDRIALVVSFEEALPPLMAELQHMACERGQKITISTAVATGALEALKVGDTGNHDAIVASTAANLKDVDALVLCQFSLARAATSIASRPGRSIFTTPDSAVEKLKTILQSQ